MSIKEREKLCVTHGLLPPPPQRSVLYRPRPPASAGSPPSFRYKYQTGRELEKAREQDKGVEELSDKDFDAFSALLRGLTNRYTLSLPSPTTYMVCTREVSHSEPDRSFTIWTLTREVRFVVLRA